MNQTQQEQLERAIQRAHARGLEVTGKGTRKSDSATVYSVSSSSQPGRWHLVLVAGAHLVCDCTAGQRGLICQHRALVRERITAERIPASRGAAPTSPTLPTHPGDTALMRRSNRPFSLLK